ncbi:BZ3500_MvSof-1268-A1-R1_Chr2-1g04546 [Microbotryum saponariae]|uniref:BZ3500_MvSof-1268-A1-R1_Chr2-1g04546 protein n=1 Tax=Microbotryum saponariae TaxID=289078 RepID=A0A2X0K913_9BASI|nr:BZ3500_MvSof-1268-A1-R1_Chr2-1g04546 [Microbotryum saponariae]SCZ91985.1 BZ3501_MvSof-1269-A2-R1_Chr2-1g04202 [Microbotryum saponariae]
MSVLSPLRSPGAKAVQLYWVVAIASTLLSTWIGSLSEYRFPHTLLTTSLHLSFALATVVVLSSLTTKSPGTRSRQLTSSPSNGPRTSDYLLLPRPLNLSTILTPVAVSTVVSAQISALHEDSLASVAEQPFMSFIRILPIFLFICLPLKDSASWPRITATLLGLVLGAGPAVRINGGSSTAWWGGGVWAFSTCVWAFGLHAGLGVKTHQTVEPEERQTTEAPPTGTGSTPRLNLPIYIGLLLLFNLMLLVFSGEVGRASSSGHFGFFTSAGFWIQELVMAWCSLARLVAFWNLFHHLDPLSILLVASVKDFLLPLATSFTFGNPLSTQEQTGSALMTWQQALIIAGVGWSALSEGQAGTRRKRG